MIYLHVPFCRSFCIYCDFYSEIPGASEAAGVSAFCNASPQATEKELFHAYAKAVAAEIVARAKTSAWKNATSAGDPNLPHALHSGTPFATPNTLYIGGGTPSLLPLSDLQLILDTLKEHGVSPDFQEFTIEVNPDDIVRRGPEYVKGLKALGVNRVSMGVQSFDDNVLRWMRRRHDSYMAVRAYEILREAGIENISIDLMFGMACLSDEAWKDTIEKALTLPGGPPEHISAYQLSIEPGSALVTDNAGKTATAIPVTKYADESAAETETANPAEANPALAADSTCQAQYAYLCRRLKSAGYSHYEISNFARPGHQAIHNSAYWTGAPYIGLGPAAHSYDPATRTRTWNRDSLPDYLASYLSPTSSPTPISESEFLTMEQSDIETIMLSLRTANGLPASKFETICGRNTMETQLRKGNLEYYTPAPAAADSAPQKDTEPHIRIPESRLFISDSIITDCLRVLP